MNLARFALTVIFCLSLLINLLIYLTSVIVTERVIQRSPKSKPTVIRLNDPSGFPLNHPHTCNGDVDLIVIVCTSLGNSESRDFIRKSWGMYSKNHFYKTKLVFLVGMGNESTLDRVQQEDSIHRDIILGNFVDTYRNLTLKSISMLKWIKNYCANAKYGLKVDDDMFINIPNLVSAMNLKRRRVDKFLIGSKQVGARPIKDKNSKYYTSSKEFGEKFYPPYLSGTAYAFTVPAARALYDITGRIKPFWMEDIHITGICASAAGIPRFDHSGFTFQKRRPSGCSFRNQISGHYVTGEQMLKIYRELSQGDLQC
ncbi:beta-1,3-galactosyltransferase 1-like [Saccostrea echinata]|uniref:beta-1,3-galactosyltransferase 1-like n=1 Tax=Saccostrea echinata TaxID=191078 RepID=UPI002A7ECEDE|nr:beta-1,3-galactosyltransferase 1-like [Saccostrea echinata]XP_061178202.1 beta-1,3-galactosyltransferase 1-like [Saccostrea echinata]XP_061178203.1 beta-1,3-galactosyltransferase 1-like [Saccostrea echinata]